ncbi:MAG: hypothetical protein NTU60_13955 [Candidatus Aminicenantes bacterium]|jgi:ABC-type nitrate/sulfonate/bicarbonate transport system substrate-binding protein|nr:hypothetical protein [Candidatus Aminicenantes bacterium]
MRIVYHLIVLYLTVHFLWYLAREKKFWKQAGIVLVLIMFLLRLFLVE